MRHLQGRWPTPHIYVQWKVPSPATCDAARGASGAKASASSRLQEINAKRCCTNFFLQKDASQTSPCNMSLLQLCFAWPEIGLRSIVWRERRVAEAQGVLPKWLPQPSNMCCQRRLLCQGVGLREGRKTKNGKGCFRQKKFGFNNVGPTQKL